MGADDELRDRLARDLAALNRHRARQDARGEYRRSRAYCFGLLDLCVSPREAPGLLKSIKDPREAMLVPAVLYALSPQLREALDTFNARWSRDWVDTWHAAALRLTSIGWAGVWGRLDPIVDVNDDPPSELAHTLFSSILGAVGDGGEADQEPLLAACAQELVHARRTDIGIDRMIATYFMQRGAALHAWATAHEQRSTPGGVEPSDAVRWADGEVAQEDREEPIPPEECRPIVSLGKRAADHHQRLGAVRQAVEILRARGDSASAYAVEELTGIHRSTITRNRELRVLCDIDPEEGRKEGRAVYDHRAEAWDQSVDSGT